MSKLQTELKKLGLSKKDARLGYSSHVYHDWDDSNGCTVCGGKQAEPIYTHDCNCPTCGTPHKAEYVESHTEATDPATESKTSKKARPQ